jgi:hypothetical protein
MEEITICNSEKMNMLYLLMIKQRSSNGLNTANRKSNQISQITGRIPRLASQLQASARYDDILGPNVRKKEVLLTSGSSDCWQFHASGRYKIL